MRKIKKATCNKAAIGRPKKKKPNLNDCGHLAFIVQDVRAILNKSRQRNPTHADAMDVMEIKVRKGSDGNAIERRFGALHSPSVSDETIGVILTASICPG